ncbi:hypothetical protein K505DRAFT_157964 [Melanomma pulvis-pyrius CBS 109.77]|uniref:Transmembrane protein n=1 Tax=Melanomma pulvis-pyrius CBS 109.77 TaxID=1314802 RepID=A0A6A6XJN5_9PLEO|nr:hypothetical protein K505DRAFT_157964 [Melanomma pulvis-pyrius CBS 109.77]
MCIRSMERPPARDGELRVLFVHICSRDDLSSTILSVSFSLSLFLFPLPPLLRVFSLSLLSFGCCRGWRGSVADLHGAPSEQVCGIYPPICAIYMRVVYLVGGMAGYAGGGWGWGTYRRGGRKRARGYGRKYSRWVNGAWQFLCCAVVYDDTRGDGRL